ncbi:hypothetical protein PPACK8108_LOCUS3473 [Phakopsora pachyrhizi]|uniref:Uncharacterized protein n=1 Tax=Phakopsora pachyrhizi TaxID=170000 RepID=A0AAV0ALD5_PHAPC|nr:hypothetical protein PPACK8108_LOCUS3473 [Phakopsora pachyrhizi]
MLEEREKKATREKIYIPPQTYASEADPIDTLGLGSSDSPVRPERAVMLRKLSKKDPTDQADEIISSEKRSGDDWDGIIAALSLKLFNQLLDLDEFSRGTEPLNPVILLAIDLGSDDLMDYVEETFQYLFSLIKLRIDQSD